MATAPDSNTQLFNQLAASQLTTGELIETIIRNIKKDSASRKTPTYYEERLRRLDVAWTEFETTDSKIRCLEKVPEDHKYFTEKVYERISERTTKYRDMLEAATLELSNNQPAESNQRQITDKPTALARSNTNKSETTARMSSTNSAIRRQNVMMGSLKRLLTMDPTAANMKLKENLWEQIQKLHFEIWEGSMDPLEEGYDMESYINLEELIIENFKLSSCIVTEPTKEQIQIHLPKIEMPKFSGNYLQWVAFKDLYNQLVHNTPMSNVQKMFYLTTHLGEGPKNLIKHLTICTENYEVAWKILVNRFDNKRLIVTTLLNSLLGQTKLKNETAQALKNLHDVTQECMHGLKAQGLPIDEWSVIMAHIIMQKLSSESQTIFEQSLNDNKRLVNLSELLSFIENRFQALEAQGKALEGAGGRDRARTSATTSTSATCKVCGSTGHPIFYCEKFLKMTPRERLQWTQKRKLCVNCFKADHVARTCNSRSCTKCFNKHNSLLHLESANGGPLSTTKPTSRENTGIKHESANGGPLSTTKPTSRENTGIKHGVAAQNSNARSNAPVVAATNKQYNDDNYILLATARVKVIGNNGRIGEFRALLDSGSQVNLVTERLVSRLALQPSDSSLCIEGIGRKTRNVAQRVNFELCSHTGTYSTRVEAFILPNIVSPQPTETIDTSGWALPQNIKLADPRFHQTDKIDILIGAEFYHQLMMGQQIKFSNDLPILQNTTLGWVVAGKIQGINSNVATCAVFSEDDKTTNQLIEKFWKLEETSDTERQMSSTEKRCETLFVQTVTRTANGRFVVRLPFSENPKILGNSKTMAVNRFISLEGRLLRDPKLRSDYSQFLEEYESLGHMEEIREEEIPKTCYVMPHHCVIKPDSSTTKLRVVFDASAKTSSGSSLNDILHTGPTVQSDLFSILLRFRVHRFVFTADIEKMYRQILVNEADQMFQLIVWRDNQHQPVRYYRLKTVTYGTAAAPYLATKCLQHLATQRRTRYPVGAQVLLEDFYVDDCLSGADSINAAIESQKEVQALLNEAGFKLRKWCSNHPQLLSEIPPEDQEINLNLDDSTIKTLGMIWMPRSDQLCGRAQMPPATAVTKRIVSSELARIFDPLGLFGPVVVRAKIFLQQLWQLSLSWDDELPTSFQLEWNNFRSSIQSLNSIKVDRHIFKQQNYVSTEIHTFVDASERAYGAAIYIRSIYADTTVATRLLCSKSRVAPIKKQTLPRLELCAAVLGVELTARVKRDLHMQDIKTLFWSDSKIVLAWINSSAASFHTFVANRIAKIQQLSVPCQWRHVPSKHNPAIAVSRGLAPEALTRHSSWLYGPLFLSGNPSQWPGPYSKDNSHAGDEERRKTKQVLTASTSQSVQETIAKINHRNSFKFLQRTVAYVLRFIRNARITRHLRPIHKTVDVHELDDALTIILKGIQKTEFEDDLQNLQNHRPVNKSSTLASLTPFLDDQNLMRVGGRLEQADLPFEAKHPAILPHNHIIVRLILQMLHEENRHCGPQALLAISRSRFWITNGKIVTRSIVHKCVRCTRAKPTLFKQLMGNLPAERVTAARPFITSGVDYFGPVWIHHKLRGKRPDKAYIAVFCCFATKAIHMEVVSNLSTEVFLGALRRFIGRRGHCQTLYCDNATNFVGANNKLLELRESIYSQGAQEKILQSCSSQAIEFKFIPPRAPHFGGLWEAAVKSAKHLLIRSASAASLTYEELETVIIEIEAILNSRPLIPMSASSDDFQALTPGHFLVGEALTTPVDPKATPTRASLGARWRVTSEIKHKFWKEWTQKYLHQLQERGKWKTPSPNITEGMLVILKEDNIPVLQWPLGRILNVYRGDDGLVRVIDVKTVNGTFKRPIHRLAPLFNDSNIETSAYETSTGTHNAPKRQYASQCNNESSLPKRKLVSYSTLFIALLLLPLAIASPINITKFTTTPGLYFEGIGSTKLVTATWKFVIFYDLAPVWKRNKVLQEGIISFSTMCNRSLINESCSSLAIQLQHLWDELIQEADLLTPTRNRRAAINIIGNVAHTLFGVLDSDYAEEMDQTITKVKENEEYLHTLIKKQTSVIDSTINILKESDNNTMIRFKQLKHAFYEDLNTLADANSNLQQAQYLTSLAIQLNMLALDLQRIELELIATLTHTNHGSLSPFIITPVQLRQEISKIKGHLPPGRTLPVDDNDLLELYKLMKIRGAVTRRSIIFVAEIPLVNQEIFHLYQIIPIPTQFHSTLINIQTNTGFLAVNDHRDEYLTISALQFTQCIVIVEDQFLCSHLQVRTRNSVSTTCEISLFNNKTSPECNLEHTHSNVSFTAMHQLNHWIYATTITTELIAVCGSETNHLQISGSGMLAVDPTCIIKGDLVIIQGHKVGVSTIHTSYAAGGNITAIGKPAAIKRIHELDLNLDNKMEQLLELQKQLQTMNDLPAELQPPARYIQLMGPMALILIIAMGVIYIAWQARIKRQRKTSLNLTPAQPQAAPRQKIPEV